MFLDEEGRPRIMNWLVALLITLVLVAAYAMIASFSLVFKVDGEVVYTQKNVKLFSDFSETAAEDEGSEIVYGDDALDFCFAKSDNEKIAFEEADSDIKVEMVLLAIKNLFTFKWGEENYVIELNAV